MEMGIQWYIRSREGGRQVLHHPEPSEVHVSDLSTISVVSRVISVIYVICGKRKPFLYFRLKEGREFIVSRHQVFGDFN